MYVLHTSLLYMYNWRAGASQPSRSTGTILFARLTDRPLSLHRISLRSHFYERFCIFSTGVRGAGPVTCRNVLRISKYTTNELLHHAVIMSGLYNSASSCRLPSVHAGWRSCRLSTRAINAFMQAVNAFLSTGSWFMHFVNAFMQAASSLRPPGVVWDLQYTLY